LHGDATDDAVLEAAGIDRARALVAALNADADNLYVTLTARGLRKNLFIVSRARVTSSEGKLLQAGADRVVNPQRIGGDRMAAFVRHPHVAEFLDVVMHDENLEFRLEEIEVTDGSPLAGRTLREASIRENTGALILAMRGGTGRFTTNPDPEARIGIGHILIAIGTGGQLASLESLVAGGGGPVVLPGSSSS
jgi:voltage-gated potassium channel